MLAILRRWPGTHSALVGGIVTSFLLGACYAYFPQTHPIAGFISVGIWGTTTSFIVVAGELHVAANGLREGIALFRRVVLATAVQAILCLAFVAVGYLVVDFAILVHHKSQWG